MKVLLVVSHYNTGSPFVKDLEKNLRQEGLEVDVLDSGQLYLKRHDGSVRQLVKGKVVKRLLVLRKIGTAIRVWKLKSLLRTCRGRYNAVNVHSCDDIYIHVAGDLQKVSPNLYPMIWGSDFYRASPAMREKKRIIFDKARYIIFGNPVNALDFTSYYNGYKEKAIITGFGVSKFDTIKRIRTNEPVESLKERFGFPPGKIAVAIGYNGTKEQQHEKLLEELALLPDAIKQRLFLVFQMTYGYKKDYAEAIRLKALETKMDFKLITDFLNDDETSRLRLATDVVLNAQITDGFSSSIQEHIYAGNIVVVGEWLPYQPLELAGIRYFKKPLGAFASTVKEILGQFPELKVATQGNSEKMYTISSWPSRIRNWISIYDGDGAKFLFDEKTLHIR